MHYSISIPWSQISGKFDLELSIQSDQRSIKIWRKQGAGYYRLIKLKHIPIKLSFQLKPSGLFIDAETESELNPELLKELRSLCIRMFSLDLDLERFYRISDPILAQFTRAYPGLRLMLDPDLAECLISFICTQNTSIGLWNQMMESLLLRLGEKVKIAGRTYHLFPDPNSLARAPLELLQECKLGYRAPYVSRAAKLICSGLNLDELRNLPIPLIRSKLMEIPGVGSKVADCVLLYGYGFTQVFPVDRRVRKLASKLYFGGRAPKDLQIKQYFESRYGDLAGMANVYLFSYFSLKHKFGLGPELKI